MARFGISQLKQLHRDLGASPAERRTVANAELVFAYLRHGGHQEICLSCIADLPVLRSRAGDVQAVCTPPITCAKLRCMEMYHVGNAEDLVYALRFTPELAPRIIRLLALIATADDGTVLQALVSCLSPCCTAAVDATRALLHLCTRSSSIDAWLVEHVPTIAHLAACHAVAVHLMQHMVDRSAAAEEAIFHHALPDIVRRGPKCRESVHLMRCMSAKYPRAVVRCGGLAMIILSGSAVPSTILRLYQATRQPECDQEVLGFMHCRMELPDRAERTMRTVLAKEAAPVRVLFANAFDMARAPVFRPRAPPLPDFDTQHAGTLLLTPADSPDATAVLLAPIARAAPFVDACARNGGGGRIEVPLHARHLPALVRALCYDDIPDDVDTLYALASLGHMWCAPRLVHYCIEKLALFEPFWHLADLAQEWVEAKALLRFLALEAFPDLAAEDRAPELNDFIWTCK